jgi:hypothetical protein
LKKPLKFPVFMKDEKAKSLIVQLLNKIPEVRLGGSFNALKGHAFFEEIDWVYLMLFLEFIGREEGETCFCYSEESVGGSGETYAKD